MKTKRNIFSVLNLGLFLVYFGIYIFVAYAGSFNSSSSPYSNKEVVSAHHNSIDGSSQQLSENNETENDDDFELAALKIPFLLSFVQLETLKNPHQSCAQALAEKPTNPIYLEVCNFRI